MLLFLFCCEIYIKIIFIAISCRIFGLLMMKFTFLTYEFDKSKLECITTKSVFGKWSQFTAHTVNSIVNKEKTKIRRKKYDLRRFIILVFCYSIQ